MGTSHGRLRSETGSAGTVQIDHAIRDRSAQLGNRGHEQEQHELAGLIEKIRVQDGRAFERLYDSTIDRVFALAHLIVRDRADAEEVVSDVYLAAWKCIDAYVPSRGDVVAWLLVMCRTRAIDTVRKRHARSRTREAYARGVFEGADACSEPVHEVFRAGHAMSEALSSLSPVRRHVLALAFCDGLTHREIADELSLPLGSVKSHLRRGVAHLRSSMKPADARRRRDERWL